MSDMQDPDTIETFAQLSSVLLLNPFIPGAKGGRKLSALQFVLGWDATREDPAVIIRPGPFA